MITIDHIFRYNLAARNKYALTDASSLLQTFDMKLREDIPSLSLALSTGAKIRIPLTRRVPSYYTSQCFTFLWGLTHCANQFLYESPRGHSGNRELFSHPTFHSTTRGETNEFRLTGYIRWHAIFFSPPRLTPRVIPKCQVSYGRVSRNKYLRAAFGSGKKSTISPAKMSHWSVRSGMEVGSTSLDLKNELWGNSNFFDKRNEVTIWVIVFWPLHSQT